jgi:hypothetical protein
MSADVPEGESPLFHVNDATETAESSHETRPKPVSPFLHVNDKAATSGEEANARKDGHEEDRKDQPRR